MAMVCSSMSKRPKVMMILIGAIGGRQLVAAVCPYSIA